MRIRAVRVDLAFVWRGLRFHVVRYIPHSMTATAKWRGHPIWYDEDTDTWRYEDNGSKVDDRIEKRPCALCGEHVTKKGHDDCIADLPGVENACCGHGVDEEAYVVFEDDRDRLSGFEARAFQLKHSKALGN